uniref:Nucleoside diphosphate kinase n=1 Tax=Oryza punctata TaxID=4537 RepID=A0A0E0MNC1_ORYPU
MDAMAVLARTSRPAPTLLAATSPAVSRRPASLSFAAATSGSRGRVSLSVTWGGRAARAHVSAGRIVASSVEQSYIMVKPDGVQRGLVGEIISRFEKKGFVLKGLKLFQCPKDLAEEHYKDLKEKSFFPGLIEYITSGPVVCMAWEGDGVVASARKLIGATNPLQAEPGTIRGDLAVQTGRNVVHGSDSPDNGKREIDDKLITPFLSVALWFKEGELCEWESVLTPWVVE